MTRAAFTRDVVGPWLAIVVAVIGIVLVATSSGGGGVVDRRDYGAGWEYVVNRQPGAGWTDEEAGNACRLYLNGFAQLDGVAHSDAFLFGCTDAIASTDLWRRPA